MPSLLEPLLGPDRIVCLLPPGVAARLAFDFLARELGNGWADVTLRIAQGGDDWRHVMLPEFAEPVEVLFTRWRPLFVVGTGDIMRSAQPVTGWGYRLLVDDQWRDCQVIPARSRRPAPAADEAPLLGVVEGAEPVIPE